jgi:hypothetical protein
MSFPSAIHKLVIKFRKGPQEYCPLLLPREVFMSKIRDEFLSEEDLDLVNLSCEELEAWWTFWLRQAQVTNEEDKNEYSHGVFILMGNR